MTDAAAPAALHVLPSFGLPYAEAGVTPDGKATATCPVCDQVFTGSNGKDATRAYGEHFTTAAAAEAAPVTAP